MQRQKSERRMAQPGLSKEQRYYIELCAKQTHPVRACQQIVDSLAHRDFVGGNVDHFTVCICCMDFSSFS
jgi:hypothetical protein